MSERILIVDDEPVNVAILEEILEDDYVLETAASGEQALERLEHFDPDLILLDIMMPGINGYEVCRKIRTSPRWPGVKIALVSAKAMTSERIEGYEAGADDYITKPFDPEELLAKVRVYLRLKTLEEVDRIQRDILMLLSHETRTPLFGILGPAEMLTSGMVSDPAEQKELLLGILTSGQQLHSFFDKVLFLCQLKVNQVTFQRRSHDLEEAVRQTAEGLSTRSRELDVRIQVHGSGPLPVLAEEESLDRVLTGLLENALRFSPRGGVVAVELDHRDASAVLVVSDQGPGVPRGIESRLFQAFAVDDITHHAEGVGLSLAIAHAITRDWGGTLQYRAGQPHGAVFELRLPIHSSAVSEPSDPSSDQKTCA